MEDWNDGVMGEMFALCFIALHSAIRNLHSAIQEGVTLCYGS
jgi:hypothetical protein